MIIIIYLKILYEFIIAVGCLHHPHCIFADPTPSQNPKNSRGLGDPTICRLSDGQLVPRPGWCERPTFGQDLVQTSRSVRICGFVNHRSLAIFTINQWVILNEHMWIIVNQRPMSYLQKNSGFVISAIKRWVTVSKKPYVISMYMCINYPLREYQQLVSLATWDPYAVSRQPAMTMLHSGPWVDDHSA